MSEPDFKKARYAEDLQDEKILDYVKNLEDDGDVEASDIDIHWLTRLSDKLKQDIETNEKLRSKYAFDSSKFADSEYQLDATIKELTNITEADPPIYDQFITLIGPDLEKLNNHSNDQIWESLRSLYNDVFDFSDEEDMEGKESLVKYLIDHPSLLNSLIDRIHYEPNERIEELEIIDNILKVDRPELDSAVLENETFVSGLLSLISKFKGTENFDYEDLTVDILSKVIQHDPKKFLLNYPTTVEILLIQLSRFRNFTPKGSESSESAYSDILILSIKLLLLSNKGVSLFLENEGFELLSIILKNSKNKFGIETFVNVLNSVFESDDQEIKAQIAIKVIRTNVFLKLVFKFFPNQKDLDRVYQFVKFLEKLFLFLPVDSDERLRLVNKLISNDHKNIIRLDSLENHYSELIGHDFTYTSEEDDKVASYADRIWNGLNIVQESNRIKVWLAMEDTTIETQLKKKGLFDRSRIQAVLQGHLQELQRSSELSDEQHLEHMVQTQLTSVQDLLDFLN